MLCPAFLLPGGVKPQPLFPKQPLDWEEDIQLWSWFLDRKVRRRNMTRGHGAVPFPSSISPGGSWGGVGVGGRLATILPCTPSSVGKDPGILLPNTSTASVGAGHWCP